MLFESLDPPLKNIQWSVAPPRSGYSVASGQIKHLCNDKQVFIPFYSANTVVVQARARQALAWACELIIPE